MRITEYTAVVVVYSISTAIVAYTIGELVNSIFYAVVAAL